MLNQVVIVGRLVKDPEVRSTSDGKKVSHIALAVSRNFKSTETGKYETDFIYCTLWEGIAVATANHCQKGSIIGLKGRIASKYVQLENDKRVNYPELVAEKVSFISTNKNKTETESSDN